MRPCLHKMWLKDWFPSVPNGLVIKKRFSPHIYLWDIRENFRTRRQKSVKGVQVPETALPEV